MMYLFVGMAGFLGAILRYSLGFMFLNEAGVFPIATLAANLLGSFLLSWLVTRAAMPARLKTAVATGLIGAFTTFSTFSVETVTLVENGHLKEAIIYVFASVAGGLLMSRLGFRATQGEAA